MKRKIGILFLFLIGFFFCLYPFVSNLIQRYSQEEIISTYEEKMKDTDRQKELFEQAKKYNQMLLESKGVIASNQEFLTEKEYEDILNVDGNGLIGSIEIPKINVQLPIRHGTSNEVLSNGVGHIEGSSFPIGTKGGRSLLTSHRGMPSSRLFTRLDELKEGDLFYISVCGKTLAYEVNKIEVIEPDDIEKLYAVPGEDLVSLITCTPYGVNTHRLILTGKRVPFQQRIYEGIQAKPFSFREFIFTALPFLFVAIGIGNLIRNRRRDNEKLQI